MIFTWMIFGRNVLLAYIEDPFIRSLLGETLPSRPAKQLTMAVSIWSMYAALLARLYYRGEKYRFNQWVTPYLIFKGFVSPGSHGMNTMMVDTWFSRTKKNLNKAVMIV